MRLFLFPALMIGLLIMVKLFGLLKWLDPDYRQYRRWIKPIRSDDQW